jgi:hypothetical protein
MNALVFLHYLKPGDSFEKLENSQQQISSMYDLWSTWHSLTPIGWSSCCLTPTVVVRLIYARANITKIISCSIINN